MKKKIENISKFLWKKVAILKKLRIILILARRKTPWKGGRVVECTALERRHTVIRIEGSNPSPSARIQKRSLRDQTPFCFIRRRSRIDRVLVNLVKNKDHEKYGFCHLYGDERRVLHVLDHRQFVRHQDHFDRSVHHDGSFARLSHLLPRQRLRHRSLGLSSCTFDDPFGIFRQYRLHCVVFSLTPRIAIASLLAFLFGSLLNARMMARMKAKAPNQHFSLRAIASTVVGESIDSLVFYPIAFSGLLPITELLSLMIFQVVMKTVYEIVALPMTITVVRRVEAMEEKALSDKSPSPIY